MNISLVAIGVTLIGGGIFQSRTKQRRLNKWVTIEGTVENIRRDQRGDATVMVQHFDMAQTRHSIWLPVADGDTVGLGSARKIAYNPADPKQAFVGDSKDMNWTAILAIGGGAALIALGVFDLRIPG